jgi:hypothetical protein
VAGDLGDDVGGGAEAVEADPLGVARKAERAVADQPGAEERRRLEVVETVGNRQAVALVCDDPVRVAAVEVVAGEARRLAEVLAAGEAEAARAVRPAEPRHSEALPVLRPADDLVAQDEWKLRIRQLAVHDVEIGAADAAGRHAEPDLAGRRHRRRNLLQPQRLAGRVEHHRTHG